MEWSLMVQAMKVKKIEQKTQLNLNLNLKFQIEFQQLKNLFYLQLYSCVGIELMEKNRKKMHG